MFSKNSFPLKRSSLLIALVLSSPAALAAGTMAGVSDKPLSLNYSRVNNAGTFNTFGANFCHLKTDELKIHIIPQGMKIRPGTRITLTVSGDNYIKSYAVFKKGSPVSPGPSAAPKVGKQETADYFPGFSPDNGKKQFFTKDFVKDWLIDFSANVHGSWSYRGPSTPKIGDVYKGRFCFYQFPANQINSVGGYYDRAIFFKEGRWPIFEDPNLTRKAGLPPIPGVLYNESAYSFNKVCLRTQDNKQLRIEVKYPERDPGKVHYWPAKDIAGGHIKRPDAITKYIAGGSSADYFDREIFYTDIVRGVIEGESTPGPINYTQYTDDGRGMPKHTSQKTVTYNILSGLPTDSNAKSVEIESGQFDLTVSNRNIHEIVLTVSEGGSTQTLTWKGGDGVNDMTFTDSAASGGARIFKTGPAVDKTNDPYADFYQNAADYFRGTLATVNNNYMEYINKNMPLSLPPKDKAGNLNLINMEELTFTLGGGGVLKTDPYTLSVEGTPLKFAPLYMNGKIKVSAMELRNSCK